MTVGTKLASHAIALLMTLATSFAEMMHFNSHLDDYNMMTIGAQGRYGPTSRERPRGEG